MNCPNCGGILPEGVTSCPSCGAFLNNQMPVQQGMVQQPMQDPMMGMAQQPVQDPMMGMAQQPMQDPMMGMAQQPVQDPMMGMAQQPMQDPMMGMAQQPVQDPMMGMAQQAAPATMPSIKALGVAKAIILSLLTCGIYGLVWFVKLTNDSNSIAEQNKTASGGMAILLTMVTCGLYSFYWVYKLGKKIHEGGTRYGVPVEDRSTLYIILTVLGFGIVAYVMAQSDLNKFANNNAKAQ